MKPVVLVFCALLVPPPAFAQAPPSLPDFKLEYRWVFTMTNLLREEALQKTIDLMKRSQQAGYNGIFVADSKFDKYQLQDRSYSRNVQRLRRACTEQGMQLIAPVCPMGYCAEFLAADPHLAEGMPVRGAAFQVREGKLVPVDDTTRLNNGSLEKWKGDVPVGWTVDRPGSQSFRDNQVRWQGRPTLRQEHARKGPMRLMQKVKVRPWQYYHLSVMARTEDCTSGDFRIFAMGTSPTSNYPLNWQPPAIKPTMDWTRLHATFTSADNTEVLVYFASYSPRSGKIWWSDVQIEPGGLVNVIRRPSLPLTVASEDGQTTYTEGRDFSDIRDPKLGNDPNPGYFTYWHEPPQVTIPRGSTLREGQKVRLSYHFATLVGKSHQINCCFSEPKVYDLIDKQVHWVSDVVQPDFYVMAHDEVRHGGWDDSCTRRHLTCGQILAENTRKCVEILQRRAPGKPILAWNDMFDPFHNAHKDGQMYLTRSRRRLVRLLGRTARARHDPELAAEQLRQPEVLCRSGSRTDPGGLLRCRSATDRTLAPDGLPGERRLRGHVYHLGERLLQAGSVPETGADLRGPAGS